MWLRFKDSVVNTNAYKEIRINWSFSRGTCDIVMPDIACGVEFCIVSGVKNEVAEWLLNKIADALANDVKLFDFEKVLKEYKHRR